MQTTKPALYYVLQSRKFWAAVIGLVFIFVNAYLNKTAIDPNTITTAIMGIVAAYMGSVALEDGMTNRDAGRTKVDTPATGGDVTVTTTAPPISIGTYPPGSLPGAS